MGHRGGGARRGQGDRADHQRGRPGGRTGAVGRRQQLPGHRARRDRRLRAERGHQHHAAPARHRRDRDRGQRARPRPRRAALHELPDRAGSGLGGPS